MFSNVKNNLRNKLVIPLFVSLSFLGFNGSFSSCSEDTVNSTIDSVVVDDRPNIVKEFSFYEHQIKENFPKLQKHINFFSSFDTLRSNNSVVSKTDLENYVVSLVTQESNFIQRKYDGSILSSWAKAVGVSQFTTEGVKAVNNYLKQKRSSLGTSIDEKLISKTYNSISDVDFDLLLRTDSLGLATGFNSATLLSKIQLQRHPDSWKFAAIEYNWGRTRKGDYSKVEPHLPRETKDYVKRIEQHMGVYTDDEKSYERYLVQRWGVIAIELENMYGNKALKKKDTLEAFTRFDNALILNDHLIKNNLDTIMRYHETIVLHANYELGTIKKVQGDTLGALKNYSNVLSSTRKNKEKRYEYKNSVLFLNKIKYSAKDSSVYYLVNTILDPSDSTSHSKYSSFLLKEFFNSLYLQPYFLPVDNIKFSLPDTIE